MKLQDKNAIIVSALDRVNRPWVKLETTLQSPSLSKYTAVPHFSKLVRAPLNETTFIVFDLETSGGNPERSSILEIAALKIKNGIKLGEFQTLVTTKNRIPRIVRDMTGIDNAMVKDAPEIEDVFGDFMDFVADGVLVSHNIHSDLSFVRYWYLTLYQKDLPHTFLCSHLLSQKLVPDSPSFSLTGLISHIGQENTGAHRAMQDAIMGWGLFKEILVRLNSVNITHLDEAIRYQNDHRTLLLMSWHPGIEPHQVPGKPGVITFYNVDNKIIFAFGTSNLKRELKVATKVSTVPRSLQKILFATHRIDIQEVVSTELALQIEEKLYRDHSKTFLEHPYTWGQRNHLCGCIRISKSYFSFSIEHPESEAFLIFGPVADKTRLVEAVFRSLDSKSTSIKNAWWDLKHLPRLYFTLTGNYLPWKDALRCFGAAILFRFFTSKREIKVLKPTVSDITPLARKFHFYAPLYFYHYFSKGRA